MAVSVTLGLGFDEGTLIQLENIADLLELDLEMNHSHYVLYKELCSDLELAHKMIYIYDRVYQLFLKNDSKTKKWFFKYNSKLGDYPINMIPQKLDYLVGYINDVIIDGSINPGLAYKA